MYFHKREEHTVNLSSFYSAKSNSIVLILSAREINIPGFPIIGGIDLSRGVCSGFSVTRTRCWVPVVRPLILFDPDSIKIECVHWTRPISSGILFEAYGWFSYKKRYFTISLRHSFLIGARPSSNGFSC